jgi:site-specific recombinase XerD
MLDQFDLSKLEVASQLDWMEEFSLWLHVNDRSDKTISAYLQDVRHFAEFFARENGSAFVPGQLNVTDVKAYFRGQDADKCVAPASRNRRLATIRVLVRWSVEAGVLEYDPTVSIKRQPVEPSPRDRTEGEMKKLNAVIGAGSHLKCESVNHVWLGLRDSAIWNLFNSAGLRISEVVGLDVSDLDFAANEINVLGKGGKKATVRVQADAMHEIAEWLRTRGVASEAVICDWNGERITRGQAWRRIKLIGEAGGVGDLKPHDLRHTFAFAVSDALKKQGLPETAVTNGVRKQLRHADEKTTRLYFGVRDSQIRAAMEDM